MRRSSICLVAMFLLSCSHLPEGAAASPAAVALPRPVLGPDQPSWEVPVGAQVGERERCVDRELATRNLNQFGDPEGTTYPADAPVLSLTSRADRYRYVMRRHPDIGVSCTRAPHEPTP